MNYLGENSDGQPIYNETIDFGVDGEIYHEYICYVINGLYDAFGNIKGEEEEVKIQYGHVHQLAGIMAEWLTTLTDDDIESMFPMGHTELIEDYDICVRFVFNVIIMLFPLLCEGFMIHDCFHVGGGVIECRVSY